MLVPAPLEAPLTPVCDVVQENVVLPTLLVNAIAVVPPEQKLCEDGVAVAVGTGFTNTVAVDALPEQVPIVGVMV